MIFTLVRSVMSVMPKTHIPPKKITIFFTAQPQKSNPGTIAGVAHENQKTTYTFLSLSYSATSRPLMPVPFSGSNWSPKI